MVHMDKMKYFCAYFDQMNKMHTRSTLLLILLLLLGACGSDPEKEARNKGVELWFSEYEHDYGEIIRGSDGNWSFVFKNIGSQPIVINRVRSSCGCTVPAWPREPVEPGASDTIVVRYNTEQTGTFYKSMMVYSSAANSPVKLKIKGKVLPEKENV